AKNGLRPSVLDRSAGLASRFGTFAMEIQISDFLPFYRANLSRSRRFGNDHLIDLYQLLSSISQRKSSGN
ncbi:hypothetical protein, partial [Methylosinus sp. R-45379]|uniref:hypothetical protein n=1 Tax=Methylosinus sp. R-45379 TaxID=980563 RepID=UPI001AECFF94